MTSREMQILLNAEIREAARDWLFSQVLIALRDQREDEDQMFAQIFSACDEYTSILNAKMRTPEQLTAMRTAPPVAPKQIKESDCPF